jgi:hypothetical protein
MLWVRISIRVRCTTLCDNVCQWLATGRGFSPGPPVSSANKTDRHDITEILSSNKQTINLFCNKSQSLTGFISLLVLSQFAVLNRGTYHMSILKLDISFSQESFNTRLWQKERLFIPYSQVSILLMTFLWPHHTSFIFLRWFIFHVFCNIALKEKKFKQRIPFSSIIVKYH